MPIYSFNSSDKYWHDSSSYSEIGELHTDKNFAIVGKVDSRYPANKKKSIISPDSDRLLYNYFSYPDVKDVAIVEETSLTDEKMVFVGSYFISIFDSRTGNFICENPKSFLKDLIKPIDQGGLGYVTNEYGERSELSAEDFDSVCANMSYAIPQQNYVYIGSKLKDGKNVLFRINPYDYTVSSFHADGFITNIGSKTMYCKPFAISSNIYYLLYNSNTDALECYCVDTYGTSSPITGYSSKSPDDDSNSVVKTIVNGIKHMLTENTKKEGSIVALVDKLRNNIVYFFAATSDTTKAIVIYNPSVSVNAITAVTTVNNWPSFSADDYFIQASIYNDKSSFDNRVDTDDEYKTNTNMYIVLLSKNGNLITRTAGMSNVSSGATIQITNGTVEGFFRSILNNPNTTNKYEYILNLLCKKTNGYADTIIYPITNTDITSIISNNNPNIDLSEYNNKNALLETYSKNITINGNVLNTKGSNIIIGSYSEGGRSRPLIKDIGNDNTIYPSEHVAQNYPYDLTNKKTFRKGLEPENGVSFVKNVSFGNTHMSRIRILPETAARKEDVTQFGDAEIFMRESNTSDKSDGKFTSGSFLWKMLAKTGIPYNTHINTIGRIILDGKDIPVEDILITPPDESLKYGNVLLTIDKLYDIACVSNNFTKNGKALYPGILFQNTNGFLNDAMISNVYNVDGAFAYNDIYHGELFGSTDKDIGYFDITASCLVQANDERYLLVAANFGKLASINIRTGGFTKFDGSNIGENAPGFHYSIGLDKWKTHGNICRIEQYQNKIYLFYSTGYIYKTTLNNPAGFAEIDKSSEHIIEGDYGLKGITRVSAKYGDVIYFASNETSVNQCIECFDLAAEKISKNYASPSITRTSTNGTVFASIEVDSKIYIVSGKGYIEVFNKVSNMTHLINVNNVEQIGSNCKHSMVYDGNDKIYIVTSNAIYSLSISKEEVSLLYVHQISPDDADNIHYLSDKVVSYKISPNNEEFLLCGYYEYDINKKVIRTVSDDVANSIKDAADSISNISAISKTGLRYLVTENDTRPTVSGDSRNSSLSDKVVSSTFLPLPNAGFISSLGFTSDGRMLIISYADGGIASYDIPFGEYYPPNESTTYKRYVSKLITVNSGEDNLKNKLIEIGIPTYSTSGGYAFDHWSKTENGNAITEDEQNAKFNGNLYAVFYDNTEPYINRSITRIFAEPGEFLSEGAYEICNIGDDVIFNTPSKTLRWAENVGVFFRGRDDKFTNKYVESDKGINNNSKSVVPMPICDAGICSIGKYIIYVNGYNKFAEVPSITAHNGVIVYDTEYDEYAVMYTGEDNLHGTKRAKINTFCYYYNGYIYEFGGLERIDEHVGSENIHVMRRTNKIEQIDLVTGQIKELSEATIFGNANIIINNDLLSGVDTVTPVYSSFGKNELRYLKRDGNLLTGYVGYGKDETEDNEDYRGKFTFDLNNNTSTFTPITSGESNVFKLDDTSELTLTTADVNIIPIESTLKYTLNDSGNPIKLIKIDNNGILTYTNDNSTTGSVDYIGKYKLDKELFINSGYKVTVPQILPDGRLFIECEPIQNGNNNSEDSIVYRHLIVGDIDETIEDIKYVPTTTGSSNNPKAFVNIEKDLYVISGSNSEIIVEIAGNTLLSANETVKLKHSLSNIQSVTAIKCNGIISIFVKCDDGIKIFTFNYINNTLKERSLNDDSINLSNIGFITYNEYFDSIDLSTNEKTYVIQNFTDESHNANETLNIRLLMDKSYKYMSSVKNETICYNDSENTTIFRDNSGIVTKSFNVQLESIYNFNGFDKEITRFSIDEAGKVTKLKRPSSNFEFRSNFVVSSTKPTEGQIAYIANDRSSVCVASNNFKTISIIDKHGFMETKKLSGITVDVRDIAMMNGVIYGITTDGKIIEFDTNTDSLVIMDAMVSNTETNESIKMCSDFKNEYIYIIKTNRIYRYNPSGRYIKLYDNISFDGNVINARYISNINELRFVTLVNNGIKLYNYIFSENMLKEIKTIGKETSDPIVGNVCEGKYVVPINFDDNGNVYIFGNLDTNASNKISVLDGNTFDKFDITDSNAFNDIPIDLSINGDTCYIVTKRNVEDNKFHIVKVMKPFNNIKSTRRSFVGGNKLCSNRTFVYNGETYIYGYSGYNHIILKLNKDTLNLEQYSNGPILNSNNEFDDKNVIGLKVFIGGVVYIVGLSNSGSTDKVRVTIVGYNLKTKTVDSVSTVSVDVPGATHDTLNVTASVGNWSSHYFTTVLHANNTEGVAVTFDMYKQKNSSTNILKHESTIDFDVNDKTLSIDGSIAVFDGKVFNVGGKRYDGESSSKLCVEYSAIHDISPDICEKYEDSDMRSNATIVKSGTHLKLISNNKITNVSRNGITPFDIYGNDGYSRFHNFLASFDTEAVKLKSGDSANFVIPCEDNCVIIDNDNVYSNSDESIDLSKNARVYQFAPSPVLEFETKEFGIHIYSGTTKDIYISVDKKTGKIVDKVEFERDYGVSVKSYLKLDSNRYIIIHSGCPNISTLFVHDSGILSIKRYDGSIFGKAIDTGTNIHSIQEVDFTILFDEEMCESDFRTVEGLNDAN